MPKQLVYSKGKCEKTVIDLGDSVKIGGDQIAVAAGPCSIKVEEEME